MRHKASIDRAAYIGVYSSGLPKRQYATYTKEIVWWQR